MYRIGGIAQQSCRGAELPTSDGGGFPDQQCGIALSRAGAAVATGKEGVSGTRKPLVLFDHFQQWAAALGLRPFLWRLIRQHRIAQSLQFRVCNSIELHPKLENRNRHQLGGVPMGAVDETRPALLERRENHMQSLF